MPVGIATKIIFAVTVVFGLAFLLVGCSLQDMPIVNPKGPIALAERDIMFRVFWIMLIVIVPVIVMTFWFAWRYRATNTKARYEPDWMSVKLDTVVWVIPTLIVIAIAIHVWIFTHKLDPYKPLDVAVEPLEVQVVAQDWKWLFIYPGQQIATVNEMAFPSGTPVTLKITSDTVMNSFFIPALAGQIYAMAGMQTQLNLMADAPGRFVGRNTQYSGDGFSDQHFQAVAMTPQDFEVWVAKVKRSQDSLDAQRYEALAKPSIAQPATYFSSVETDLFFDIIGKYSGDEMGGRVHDAASE